MSQKTKINNPIQLLRALAVLTVIAFHYEESTVPMGYLGVDIFFVISGFVITKMLFDAMSENRFTFKGFYYRRFMRLAPASLLVILITSIPLIFLAASAAKQQAAMAGFTAIFAFENWNLVLNPTNYFNPATDGRNPFIHFWSLAVEEQIYIVWPAIMWLLFAYLARKRQIAGAFGSWLMGLIGLISALSFIYGLHAESTGGTGYYPTFARVWEFGVGALGVCIARLRPTAVRREKTKWFAFLSATIVLIFECTFGWPPLGQQRILATVIACTLSLAIILLGLNPEINQFFSKKAFLPIKKIGDWSYGIYLWHFPLLAVLPLTLGISLVLWQKIVLVLLSIFLGYLSHRFVELPALSSLRNEHQAAVIFRASLAVAVVLALSLGTTTFTAGVTTDRLKASWAKTQNFLEHCVEKSLASEPNEISCFNFKALSPSTTLAKQDEFLMRTHNERCQTWIQSNRITKCEFGDTESNHSITLIGDSHAAQWLPALDAIGKAKQIKIFSYLHSACPFNVDILAAAGVGFTGCSEWIAGTLSELEGSKTDLLLFSSLGNWLMQASPQEMKLGFTKTFKNLEKRTGSNLAVIRDTPFPLNGGYQSIPYCLEKVTFGMTCQMNRKTSLQQDYMAESALEVGGHVIDLSNYFCGIEICRPTLGKVLVYRDESHITETAAYFMAKQLLRQIQAISPKLFR